MKTRVQNKKDMSRDQKMNEGHETKNVTRAGKQRDQLSYFLFWSSFQEKANLEKAEEEMIK